MSTPLWVDLVHYNQYRMIFKLSVRGGRWIKTPITLAPLQRCLEYVSAWQHPLPSTDVLYLQWNNLYLYAIQRQLLSWRAVFHPDVVCYKCQERSHSWIMEKLQTWLFSEPGNDYLDIIGSYSEPPRKECVLLGDRPLPTSAALAFLSPLPWILKIIIESVPFPQQSSFQDSAFFFESYMWVSGATQ